MDKQKRSQDLGPETRSAPLPSIGPRLSVLSAQVDPDRAEAAREPPAASLKPQSNL